MILSSAEPEDFDESLSKIGLELEFLLYVIYSEIITKVDTMLDAMTMKVTLEAKKVYFIRKKINKNNTKMTILKSLSYHAWYVRQVWIIIANVIEEKSNFFYWKSVPFTLKLK